ncbi:uncharacterized protein MYCGRDRAFT_92240 [Zymoseptoria tritici IPO323]|uniref:Ca2+-modulated nonselective cation channel polycystin n=1 Tax=Zymoseptoria tritici (strain CBS 115943 / IPO323) TaxID=336722 RepID=F9X9X1_ZYMTI|nr:uncharacterized protein MYCGRDRAFT_92240 [Zymoseptoria tritici IPO323]EGP88578.1 hypothetical protein MYCGRDRAFT_92240 [Zymoseptoria tritici IPO323]
MRALIAISLLGLVLAQQGPAVVQVITVVVKKSCGVVVGDPSTLGISSSFNASDGGGLPTVSRGIFSLTDGGNSSAFLSAPGTSGSGGLTGDGGVGGATSIPSSDLDEPSASNAVSGGLTLSEGVSGTPFSSSELDQESSTPGVAATTTSLENGDTSIESAPSSLPEPPSDGDESPSTSTPSPTARFTTISIPSSDFPTLPPPSAYTSIPISSQSPSAADTPTPSLGLVTSFIPYSGTDTGITAPTAVTTIPASGTVSGTVIVELPPEITSTRYWTGTEAFTTTVAASGTRAAYGICASNCLLAEGVYYDVYDVFTQYIFAGYHHHFHEYRGARYDDEYDDVIQFGGMYEGLYGMSVFQSSR